MRPNALLAVTVLSLAALALTACESDSRPLPPVTATEHLVMQPLTTDGEPSPGITVIDDVTGHCRPSGVDPENQQARRCFTEETSVALDPCFLPASTEPIIPEVAPGTALCLSEPLSGRATRVTVHADVPPEPGNEKQAAPWVVELDNGTHCSMVGGVDVELDGLRMSYGCDDDGYLYGPIDTSDPVWTVHHQAEGAAQTEIVAIRTVWR